MLNVLPHGVRLSVAVTHHPSRSERLPALLAALEEARVVVDDRGQPPSLEGLRYVFLQACVPEVGSTHHLVLQDDALLCRDFTRSVGRVLHARPEAAVALYAARKPCAVARERGASWAELFGESWGIAMLMPSAWWLEFAAWHERSFLPTGPFHDDARVAMWLTSQGRSTWATVPSLVDHGSAKGESLLGHNSRVSKAHWSLAPHLSGLTVDWTPRPGAPKGGVSFRSLLEYHRKAGVLK